MLADAIEFLLCPICRAEVWLTGGSVCCPDGHRFDVARQGYVNLLPGDAWSGSADTREMVAARVDFHESSHFARIVQAVAAEAERATPSERPGCVVDLGAGPGHYLAAVLERLPNRVGLALDLSKHALRRTARVHPRVGAVVCDVWRPLPVKTGAAALVLNVFAPRNPGETARILCPDGALLVVTPTSRHLRELVSAIGLLTVGEDKQERIRRDLEPELGLVSDQRVEFSIALSHADVASLVGMGPSAWHIERPVVRDRLRGCAEPLRVIASVTVSLYHRAYHLPR